MFWIEEPNYKFKAKEKKRWCRYLKVRKYRKQISFNFSSARERIKILSWLCISFYSKIRKVYLFIFWKNKNKGICIENFWPLSESKFRPKDIYYVADNIQQNNGLSAENSSEFQPNSSLFNQTVAFQTNNGLSAKWRPFSRKTDF